MRRNRLRNPKDVAVPDDFDDDQPHPDAGPSGHHGPPTLQLDGDEPFNPEPMPENGPQPDSPDQQEQEEEKEPEEDTDYTIPYGSTDTNETLDYNDLVIDDSQWCLLSQDQKTCRNTASFSAPRLIGGSPVTLWNVESSSAIGISYSVSDQQHHKEKEPEAVLAMATPEERIGTTLAINSASHNSMANQLKVEEPPG